MLTGSRSYCAAGHRQVKTAQELRVELRFERPSSHERVVRGGIDAVKGGPAIAEIGSPLIGPPPAA